MKVTLNVNGVEREFQGDYGELHNMDWTGRVREMLDEEVERQDEQYNKILRGDH